MGSLTTENVVAVLGFGLLGLVLLVALTWNRKRNAERLLSERRKQRVEASKRPPLTREHAPGRLDPQTRKTAEEMGGLVEQRRYAEADAKMREMLFSWDREIEQRREKILRSQTKRSFGRFWQVCGVILFVFAGWWIQYRGNHDFIFGYDVRGPAALVSAVAIFVAITHALIRAFRRAQPERRREIKL